MQQQLAAAAIQMNACRSKEENVAKAEDLVATAARGGAQLVVLPELFNRYGNLADVVAEAEPIPGPTSAALQSWAQQLGIWLLGGSICEQSHLPGKGYNTSLFFDPRGEIVAKYRKQHLFDVNVPGRVQVSESQFMLRGDLCDVIATPWAKCGVGICYDLRFPELFRRLSAHGMELLLFPSAFTKTTGRDHWEILLRSRAIENQCYVVAANQCGRHTESLSSYGHSLILDPWGRILAEATEEEAIIHANLSGRILAETRELMPVSKHRRDFPAQ